MHGQTPPGDLPERETVSVEEFAHIIGIGRNSAYGLVKDGRIRHIRVGKLILIPRTAIDDFLGNSRDGRDS